MNNKKTENIEIVKYNPKWPQIFKNEANDIKEALGDNCLAIHHIGSTAIQGLSAKPKIDILATVKNISFINTSSLESLGFENRGEVIPTGRYFPKEAPKVHLHIFEEGNPLIEQHLKFRDWLQVHENDQASYEKLKKELAKIHTDGMSYAEAKTSFITGIQKKIEKTIHNNQQKFKRVKNLNLPHGQYAITGSGPLGIRYLREIGDIDIIVTKELWNDLAAKYGVIDQNGIKKIVIPGDNIEIFYEKSFYQHPIKKNEPSIAERISESEIIDELSFENLTHVLFYKHIMGREKDLKDLTLIKAWEKTQNFHKLSL